MHGGVERQTGGGIVAGWLVSGQCTSQGTAVADGGIPDVIHQGCQHGEMLPQSGRAGDFAWVAPAPMKTAPSRSSICFGTMPVMSTRLAGAAGDQV